MDGDMREVASHLICFFAGVSLACSLFVLKIAGIFGAQSGSEVRVDTITDTVTIVQPAARESLVVSHRRVIVPVIRDSVVMRDSVVLLVDSLEAALPITRKTYSDSSYTAWVSGFEPQLDSIRVYPRTIVRQQPAKRWSVGVQGGVGLTPKGFQPYIGVGVAYKIDI